ncbi:MAG: mannosyltransferase [Solirubrobacteraceae bacterium]|nr:mannosyltransferase [Solirubrobacteraceae bacterium]
MDGGLAVVVAIAAALRFATLGQQSFWYDESFTIRLVRGSFGDMLHGVSDTESTPPLYYVVAWLWAHVFGSGEVGLRSLSAVCGTGLVLVVFAIGRRLAGRTAGLLAAALTAVNPLLVWYSQEARSYMLVTLLCAGTVLAWLAAREPGARRALAAWALLSAAALATHYFAVFLVAPEAVALLAFRAGRGRDVWLAVGATAGAAAALLPLALTQRERSAFLAVGDVGLGDRAAAVPKQFVLGAFAGELDARWIVAAAAALGLAAGGLVVLRARRDRSLAAVATLAAVALAVPLILALGGADYLNARNVLIALPVALAAVGAAAAPGRGAGVLVAGALLLGFGAVDVAVTASDRLQRDDWRSAAREIGPGRAVVVMSPVGSGAPLGVYAKRLAPAGSGPVPSGPVWAISLRRPPGPVPAAPPGGPLRAGPLRRTASYLLRRYTLAPGAHLDANALAAKVFPGRPAELARAGGVSGATS